MIGRVGTWLVAAALLVGGGVAARAQDPTRVVIRRAEIEAAGWVNVGEMLGGATGWQRTTLDAVSFFATTDGLPPGATAPGEPSWVLLIDGQRIAADVLGTKLLELVPLSPAQVESITVTRVPRLVAGTIAGRGVIEFHTRRPARGPSASGGLHSGNIIGDPGPYEFTPLKRPNVDRLGPYETVQAGLGGAGWDAFASTRSGSSHITHHGIRERFDSTLFEQLGEHKWAVYKDVAARAGGMLLGGRQDIIAGRSWVHGPLFLPSVGSEQWLVGKFEHVGGSGSIGEAAGTRLGYQLTHTSLDVREEPSPFPFVAGHSRTRDGAVLELDLGGGDGWRARLGGAAVRWRMGRQGAEASRTDGTLFGAVEGSAGRAGGELSGALVQADGGPLSAKGVLAARLATDSRTTVSAAVSYVQHTTGEDGTWIDRVILGLDTLRRERDARAWLDGGVARMLRRGWTADLGARVGRVTNLRLLALDGTPSAPLDAGLGEVRAGLNGPLAPHPLDALRAARRA